MPTRRPREPLLHVLPLAALAAAVTLVLIAAGGHSSGSRAAAPAVSWKGLAGAERPRVAVGQRMVVLLKAPSLADRVATVGGLATDEQERRWSASALSTQRLLISRLGAEGVTVQPEYSYTRVVNGFSAAFDANGLALLERAPEVAGVYPVRATYPATVPSRLVSDLAPGIGQAPQVGLSGIDGRGVTVALLDTGVDRAAPFLRGRVAAGVDVVGGNAGGGAAPKPDQPAQLEQHGTEMAGLIVGSGGPGGMAGIAPGATVLPIRVAGWQRDAAGDWAVYGRTDQLLAGLDRAVDPNGDGDAHDAARVALVALSEPFAAFTDGPLARAVEGASRLDTLVVAPSGNDGPAGPSFGSISGPGGAPDALTVGAADLRRHYGTARVVVRVGLAVELDALQPLAAVTTTTLPAAGVAAPRLPTGPETESGSIPLLDFFDSRGRDLVAGRVALVPVGADPATTYANAQRAGAAAVLFYGVAIPGGGLGLGGVTSIPAVSLSSELAATILERLRAGVPVSVSIGPARSAANLSDNRVARFSSTGLAFDGRVKPELVAPGVGLGTAEPGSDTTGAPRYGTVNGTSAAAAVVAADAALLAQARPDLDAEALKGVLVGAARPLPADPVTAQGAGLIDVAGAAATELAASPASLAIGRAAGAHWRTTSEVLVRNVSVRTLRVSVTAEVASPGAASVELVARPDRFSVGPGRSVRVLVRARVTSALDGFAPAQGAFVVTPLSGHEIRIPWVIAFGPAVHASISAVHLSARRFRPSDTKPALLTFVAGAVPRTASGVNVVPISLLRLELWSRSGGRIGLLARLRDVLPGRYSYGVTGRDPTGQLLPAGDYVLRLVAYPPDGSTPTLRTVAFTIQ